ncbi:expressed unknown protein [Seminavis robusta]|uniref:Uncharacterized protein n=1 Tax=Seminavis robusta TaxID=568900 RepID=A0A9N8F044_9STRA|nr:expressed unknown protein [Seminavis robusta]|eukprot:Sro2527_g330311.1  (120) ;mRNA; r:10623-10982
MTVDDSLIQQELHGILMIESNRSTEVGNPPTSSSYTRSSSSSATAGVSGGAQVQMPSQQHVAQQPQSRGEVLVANLPMMESLPQLFLALQWKRNFFRYMGMSESSSSSPLSSKHGRGLL